MTSNAQGYVPQRKVPGQPGKYYNSEGYVLVWVKRGQFSLEHREIAERVIGRKLADNEVVHHINGIRSDNRNCNLLICNTSYHALLHSRCLRRFGSWHLPGVADPHRESVRRLRSGSLLNTINPVAKMMPPWEGSDTVTSENSTGSVTDASLPTIASILSNHNWEMVRKK